MLLVSVIITFFLAYLLLQDGKKMDELNKVIKDKNHRIAGLTIIIEQQREEISILKEKLGIIKRIEK